MHNYDHKLIKTQCKLKKALLKPAMVFCSNKLSL